MSDLWTIAGSATTVKVVSQSQVIDVEAVPIYTKPSQVYTVPIMPIAEWRAGHLAKWLNPPALLIEQIMGFDTGSNQVVPTYVNAAQYAQRQDNSGLLAGFMDFTVYYQPSDALTLPLTEIVSIPMTSLQSLVAFEEPIQGGTPSDLVRAAHARLVHAAAA